jgi:hypothetical protein
MLHIDWSGDRFDVRPSESQGRLNEKRPTNRKLSHCNRWCVALCRCATMSTGDTNHLNVVTVAEGTTELDGRDARTAGSLSPALLEGERHAHTIHLPHSVGGHSHTLGAP